MIGCSFFSVHRTGHVHSPRHRVNVEDFHRWLVSSHASDAVSYVDLAVLIRTYLNKTWKGTMRELGMQGRWERKFMVPCTQRHTKLSRVEKNSLLFYTHVDLGRGQLSNLFTKDQGDTCFRNLPNIFCDTMHAVCLRISAMCGPCVIYPSPWDHKQFLWDPQATGSWVPWLASVIVPSGFQKGKWEFGKQKMQSLPDWSVLTICENAHTQSFYLIKIFACRLPYSHIIRAACNKERSKLNLHTINQ